MVKEKQFVVFASIKGLDFLAFPDEGSTETTPEKAAERKAKQ